MIRKTVLPLMALGVFALFCLVNIPSVQAQGPTHTGPSSATYFDNRPHYIAANSSLWYAFDYAGDKSLILTKMFNAANTGLDYALWAPDQSDKPFGRGTAKNIACGADKCEDTDLTWKGATPVGGTYFVQVTNNTSKSLTFYLILVGSGVSFGPTPQDALPPDFQFAYNFSPDNAAVLQNNRLEFIPGDTFLWYRFDYKGDGTPIVLALVDGRIRGIYFRVYTADQARQADIMGAYLGQGGAAVADCDTGKCLLGDLAWAGGLPGNGTYYVQVYNSNAESLIFRLLLEGATVTPASP